MEKGNDRLYNLSISRDQNGRHADLKISRFRSLIFLRLRIEHQTLKFYDDCINDDPCLTMTNLTTRINMIQFALLAFSTPTYHVSVYIWISLSSENSCHRYLSCFMRFNVYRWFLGRVVGALDYEAGDRGSIPGSGGTTDWLFSAGW